LFDRAAPPIRMFRYYITAQCRCIGLARGQTATTVQLVRKRLLSVAFDTTYPEFAVDSENVQAPIRQVKLARNEPSVLRRRELRSNMECIISCINYESCKTSFYHKETGEQSLPIPNPIDSGYFTYSCLHDRRPSQVVSLRDLHPCPCGPPG